MRFILARHAETVYNANSRMQGRMPHTPLTRDGMAQAEEMGQGLRAALGTKPNVDFWASPSGRTLQTAAIVAEHLQRDFFDIRPDARLLEIDVGTWEGRTYAEIVAENGPITCPDRHIFIARPPGGEWYPDIAARLHDWLATLDPARDVLVISHGVTLRVLRGLLAGGEPHEGILLAADAPQGTVFEIVDGHERILHMGSGRHSMRSI